jgi:hypothetical protein
MGAGLTIHLGVTEIPYTIAYTPKAKKLKAGHRKFQPSYGKGKTTGDIAEILEANYGIMGAFATKYMPDIIGSLEKSYAGALKNILMGAPTAAPAEQSMSWIQDKFKTFLTNKEMEGISRAGKYPIPTKASLMGVSHRFKMPYAKRPPRPSFIDTGLYQSSFRAWMG